MFWIHYENVTETGFINYLDWRQKSCSHAKARYDAAWASGALIQQLSPELNERTLWKNTFSPQLHTPFGTVGSLEQGNGQKLR
jgi:hypothetical protein